MRVWTPTKLRALKGKTKFATLTCYDATSAAIIESMESVPFPLVLVGDSLGMTLQGHDSPLPVTMEEMIYHTRCVARMLRTPMLITDLPFGSYQSGDDEGFRNALRLIKEGGADGVKLEGGERCVPLIRRLVETGIPVCGHVGMTPQSCLAMGGFKVQGRDAEAAKRLIHDAKALESAGCFAIVLECVPATLGQAVTQSVTIPVIGIGAGSSTDGQILVWHDMLGLTQGKTAKFVRHFAELGAIAQTAFSAYATAVEAGTYPDPTESYE
ncbi:MAG: 3-methyl-2-oxobutanoate hydroxymethyltransferase [Kiritimatiellia bacterium]